VKVVMLTREYPPHVYGGAGVVVDELSRALGRRLAGVEVRCYGPREAPPGAPPGVALRDYPPWERLGAAGGSLAALRSLSVSLAMAADPVTADVAHAHTWYADLAGFLVRLLHRVPLVVTLHSLEPLRPWKAEQLGPGYALSTWVERLAVEAAERVIAVSGAMREDILRCFAVDPRRVVVIRNGVDPARFRRTPERDALLRHGVREPYVLFVGRISEQKGIFDLLEAADLLPPEVQVVLCAASPDTPELEARLAARVARRPRFRWVRAMLPPEEVVQLQSHAAAFVCPSVYEPFGLINLEAMACETPVVATDVGGIPEVVEDGVTGYLAPPSRPDRLAAALRRLLDDPAAARALGRAGRRRVEERFTWDRVAEDTERVYREAVGAFREPPG
jgi:glycogen synthase